MISKVSTYYNYTKNTGFNCKQAKRAAISLGGELLPSKIKAGYCLNISFGDVKHLSQDREWALESVIPETYTFTNPGIIRPADKLSTKDVINIFDKQLNLITAEEIETAIVASFDKNDRELVLKALQHVCQFANIESLNKMCGELSKITSATKPIYTEGTASLSSNIKYLQDKYNFKNLSIECVGNYKYISNVQSGSIILDDTLLKCLSSDTELLEYLKDNNNISIIYPESWINGINFFNPGSVENIKERVEKVVTRAREIQQLEQLDNNKAITKALNEPIIKEMERLGLTNKLKMVSTVSETETPNTTDIEKLLAPNRMSEEALQKILEEKIPENYKQLVLEILARDTNIYSPRKLNALSKKLHKQILQMAQNKGIEEKNIYYYIPIYFKSFGMSTMWYQIANEIFPEKIIIAENESTDISKKLPEKSKSMIVILDDFASSGQSMLEVYGWTVDRLIKNPPDYKVECVLAPFVSTNKAVKYVNEKFEEEKNRRIDKAQKEGNLQKAPAINCNYCPGEVIETLESTDFYKSLDEKGQKLVDKILYKKGYDDNGVSVVFPYMAPDNNHSLFAALCAPFFTLNGRGVKQTALWKPPIPVSLDKQEPQLKEIIESSKKALKTIDISRLYTKIKTDSNLFMTQKLVEDTQKYISIAQETDPKPINKLDLELLDAYDAYILSAVNRLNESLKNLNASLNNPENYQISNFDELYDKNHNIDKPLYDTMTLCMRFFLHFTGEGFPGKKFVTQIATLKTTLTKKIDDYTKIRNEKGPDFTQKEEEYLALLNSFQKKIDLLDKHYQETLNTLKEIYMKLRPSANKLIENMKKNFRDPRGLFEELSEYK